MKIFYDFHIHSALSPCGDEDMTPNNIVNMAVLKGLNAIALTDHNSVLNCPATLKAAEGTGLCVLPGMELCTAEEIHVLCLFPSLDAAMRFHKTVSENYLPVKNKPEIFGRQLIMDENDEIVGVEETLLNVATGISVDRVGEMAKREGGVALPAHIDRPSYSLTAVFGEIPENLGFNCIEISQSGDFEKLQKQYPNIAKFSRLKNSDAHYLENISEAENAIFADECTPPAIIEAIRNNFIKKQ